jgi:aerobic carbon-monoxide dehydrogenase medium subunit
MKPRAFEYFAPPTLAGALALLAQHGTAARVLAGGQSLVPLMNMRQLSPAVIVDINPLAELAGVHREANGDLVVGALTRQQQLATSDLVRATCSPLEVGAEMTAFPAVRNRGTLGGTIAQAEPGAQLPLVLRLLDASVTLVSARGERLMPLSEIITGVNATSLAPDELLSTVRVPALPPTAGFALREFRRGFAGPPLIAVAALLDLDAAGQIRQARLGVAGADDTPLRLADGEALLAGTTPTDDLFGAVAQRAAARVRRGDAVHADVATRRHVTRALLAQALRESYQHALTNRNHEEVDS